MAFWGVEVKPGRPLIHPHIGEGGPLHLSQATLGIGTAKERSVLQCNVGDKAPVLLCSLLPDRIESTCLDLEFEEKDAVVFSVIGPRSVHLAGYFLSGSSRRGGGDANDSDSYGEDIWETGSNESGSYHSSEDKYESDFIDDGDVEVSPSPGHNGGAIVEEIIEDEKPVSENRTRRRLRKKHQISDSDEGDIAPRHQIHNHNKLPVSESEEDDTFPISFSLCNKGKEKNIDGDVKLDSKILDVDKKSKLDIIVVDKDSEREDKAVAVSSGKSKKKKKDRSKSAKSLEADIAIPGENIRAKESEDQNKHADDKRDETQPCEGENEKVNQEHAHVVVLTESIGKPKKRKKEKVRRGETPETRVDLTLDKCEEGSRMEKIDTMNNVEQANIGNNDKDPLIKSGHRGVPDEKEVLGSHNKLKRKKKKTKDEGSLDAENVPAETLHKDDNDESRIMEAVKSEASKSCKKRGENQTVCQQPPETVSSVNEESVPADVRHEPSKKKQKKNR